MPQHAEERILPYSPESLYTIVADVERYPEFLPWVVDAQIIRPTPQGFIADLTVGYKLFRETYRSEVILTPYDRIDIHYIQGPFKSLDNHWMFSPQPSGVLLEFFIAFEFESYFFQKMMDTMFKEAVKKMVAAFEERARALSNKN